jgi:hypothetical protein
MKIVRSAIAPKDSLEAIRDTRVTGVTPVFENLVEKPFSWKFPKTGVTRVTPA